jgi:lactoylglutathione lyase
MDQTTQGAGSCPTDLFAITLFVEDLQAAKQFYLRVFGLPVDYEDYNSVVFKFGNTLINLLKTTAAQGLIEPAQVASREAGSRLVFTIHVDDVDAMCVEPWGVRTASFVDPGGYIWEIAK